MAWYPKVTFKRYQDLRRVFGSLDSAFTASAKAYELLPWPAEAVSEFLLWRDGFDEAAARAQLTQHEINCVALTDQRYPTLLKEISDPPLALFVRGTLEISAFTLAVVGSRRPTAYGRLLTERLVADLAASGLTIVSGLALGIDGLAHAVTLDAGGSTLAVLGSGVDTPSIAPRAHVGLAERILGSGGGLISEYPPGTPVHTYSFPKRNRIIAGLSRAVLVVEAGEKSGALITATCALESNREVLGVPHPINSARGIGVNRLLRDGAHLVTSAADVLGVLGLQKIEQYVSNKTVLPENPLEHSLFEELSGGPQHVDELIRTLKLPRPAILGTLTTMEMKGLVRNMGGMRYSR